MSLDRVKTYHILDRWCDAPESAGYQYVVDSLKTKNLNPTPEEVKQRVWVGLVNLELLDPVKKSSPRDWKRAKREYRKRYRHRMTA